MIRNILFTALFLICFTGLSQKSEIGISILSMNGHRDNYKTPDTTSYSTNNALTSLQPVLTYNYINKKNIVLSAQIGYFYVPSKTEAKDYYSDKSIGLTNGTSSKKSIFIKIGIAKRFDYEKFFLDIGLNIPFEYQFYSKAEQITNTFDSLNTFLYSYTYTDKGPHNFTTGINLQTSFYYKLGKHFALGIDLNTGYILSWMSGKREVDRVYNFVKQTPGIVSDNSVYLYKGNGSFNLNMAPAISIRYLFKQKSKSAL